MVWATSVENLPLQTERRLDQKAWVSASSAIDCTGRDSDRRSSAPPAKKMKSDTRRWQSVLQEAERELDAATTRTTLNVAAKKLMRAQGRAETAQSYVWYHGGVASCLNQRDGFHWVS
jgi:hypothetical protein